MDYGIESVKEGFDWKAALEQGKKFTVISLRKNVIPKPLQEALKLATQKGKKFVSLEDYENSKTTIKGVKPKKEAPKRENVSVAELIVLKSRKQPGMTRRSEVVANVTKIISDKPRLDRDGLSNLMQAMYGGSGQRSSLDLYYFLKRHKDHLPGAEELIQIVEREAAKDPLENMMMAYSKAESALRRLRTKHKDILESARKDILVHGKYIEFNITFPEKDEEYPHVRTTVPVRYSGSDESLVKEYQVIQNRRPYKFLNIYGISQPDGKFVEFFVKSSGANLVETEMNTLYLTKIYKTGYYGPRHLVDVANRLSAVLDTRIELRNVRFKAEDQEIKEYFEGLTKLLDPEKLSALRKIPKDFHEWTAYFVVNGLEFNPPNDKSDAGAPFSGKKYGDDGVALTIGNLVNETFALSARLPKKEIKQQIPEIGIAAAKAKAEFYEWPNPEEMDDYLTNPTKYTEEDIGPIIAKRGKARLYYVLPKFLVLPFQLVMGTIYKEMGCYFNLEDREFREGAFEEESVICMNNFGWVGGIYDRYVRWMWQHLGEEDLKISYFSDNINFSYRTTRNYTREEVASWGCPVDTKTLNSEGGIHKGSVLIFDMDGSKMETATTKDVIKQFVRTICSLGDEKGTFLPPWLIKYFINITAPSLGSEGLQAVGDGMVFKIDFLGSGIPPTGALNNLIMGICANRFYNKFWGKDRTPTMDFTPDGIIKFFLEQGVKLTIESAFVVPKSVVEDEQYAFTVLGTNPVFIRDEFVWNNLLFAVPVLEKERLMKMILVSKRQQELGSKEERLVRMAKAISALVNGGWRHPNIYAAAMEALKEARGQNLDISRESLNELLGEGGLEIMALEKAERWEDLTTPINLFAPPGKAVSRYQFPEAVTMEEVETALSKGGQDKPFNKLWSFKDKENAARPLLMKRLLEQFEGKEETIRWAKIGSETLLVAEPTDEKLQTALTSLIKLKALPSKPTKGDLATARTQIRKAMYIALGTGVYKWDKAEEWKKKNPRPSKEKVKEAVTIDMTVKKIVTLTPKQQQLLEIKASEKIVIDNNSTVRDPLKTHGLFRALGWTNVGPLEEVDIEALIEEDQPYRAEAYLKYWFTLPPSVVNDRIKVVLLYKLGLTDQAHVLGLSLDRTIDVEAEVEAPAR